MKIDELKQKIARGFELSLIKLLNDKRLKGKKLVTQVDGKIVQLSVEECERLRENGKI